MNLYERLESDARAALKESSKEKLSVLRMLLSAVKVFELEKKAGKVEDREIIEIIQRQAKQHKESIGQFKNGNRPDLADKESRELKVLESYLPEQLSEAELLKIVKDAIAETGASAKSNMGKVMKAVMEKAKGRADGSSVNKLVSGLLK